MSEQTTPTCCDVVCNGRATPGCAMQTPRIDLTEVVKVAARQIRVHHSGELHNQIRLGQYWDEGLTSPDDVFNVTRQAHAALTAALPLIERQVRVQVAGEIVAQAKTLLYDDDEVRVLHIAARIARGEKS